MTTAELEALQKADQMNIVPTSSYVQSDQEPEESNKTAYRSESSDYSERGKNLVDKGDKFQNIEDMQNEHPSQRDKTNCPKH